MKIEVTPSEVQLLVPHVTILQYNKGWFTVEEQDKKVHGYKQLKQLNNKLKQQLTEALNNNEIQQTSSARNQTIQESTEDIIHQVSGCGDRSQDIERESRKDDESSDIFSDIRKELTDNQQQIEQCEQELDQAEQELDQAEQQLDQDEQQLAYDYREFVRVWSDSSESDTSNQRRIEEATTTIDIDYDTDDIDGEDDDNYVTPTYDISILHQVIDKYEDSDEEEEEFF